MALGVALGVTDADGTLVRGKTALVNRTNPYQGVTLSLSLKSGAEYTLLVGIQTLRDSTWPPHAASGPCPTSRVRWVPVLRF